ncbi:unnamed protein product [Rotaria sp. Silwood2]|nr:unnamed protein product [Rotaria sp. Silwood2]CAF2855753.1 unnamed protein product [Rotaria sp. Silwood2]CAF3096989.1 unnamed protein product [Rotaria sp. Silwood2]CAF3185716.1 unnamed protein product [Rotaria sp. Silwood2]CAF4018594.1 unnamed protein product [Rotaria sp. Silwood2]
MESIEIQWQKQSSGDVYTLPNRQYFQQQSILKRDSQEIKPKKKKVQFKIRTPTPKIQAFENTEHNHSKIDRSQRSILEDHDYILPSTNILTAELLETCGKQVCSTRSKSLTIIIVLFIILTVAIVVGVVVGVTNSKQSISETTTTINNQTSLSTTTLVSSISIGSQSGPPCSSYTTINDPSRNVAQASLYGFCDNGAPFNTSNGGSWIRFIGTGGTTIPLTSPDENRCGGYFGGWFNGTLPTTVGIVVNGTVRFGIDRNPGIFWVSMSVINCGSFYVYFLPPVTSCSLRYCTT